MSVWSHLPTIFKRRYTPLYVGIITLCVALITTLLFVDISFATTGTNQTVSFQGRLLNSSGGVVPDGHYNMQFKIYQDGTGAAAGNPDGTLKWTDTYVNNGGTSGIEVKNGFFSVDLGSKTPFGTSVDWNQDTLWLSMNIAGSDTACTTFGTAPCAADGEMLPMKRMTATPYAMNAARLGGLDASGFIQNSTVQQTADFNISGTGTANTLQGSTSMLAPLFDRADTGTLNIGTVNASTINIGSNDAPHAINIGTGAAVQNITIGSLNTTSGTIINGGSQGITLKTNGGGFAVLDSSNNQRLSIGDGGSTFNIGGNQLFKVSDMASGNPLFSVGQDGTITTAWNTAFQVAGSTSFANGINIANYSTASSYTTPHGATLQSAINIVDHDLANYGSVLAFGVTANSSTSARGILIADARTSTHQATIGVLSPDENQIVGFSWDGSDSTAYLKNSAASLGIRTNSTTDVATFSNTAIDFLQPTTVTSDFAVNGNISFTRGADKSTTGIINDVDFGAGTLFRLTGLNVQTITGIAGGIDGRRITLVNAGAYPAVLVNNSSSSAAINRIITGTARDYTIDTGDVIDLVYDYADRLWHVIGTTTDPLAGTSLTSVDGHSVAQVGDGLDNGDPTLFTVDKASSAPTITDNALLGSMYYDTTLGKLQCYEAEGWGNCSASPDTFVTISPEYSGAVMHGADIGTISSDLCSDSLNINDGSSSQPTICGTNETHNFYKWTSGETSAQVKSIFVTYKLPSAFKEFVAGSTSLLGRTDSTNSGVTYQIYRNNGSGLTACGTAVSVSTGAQTTWQSASATGSADPSTCSFAAGDSIVFRINLSTSNNANAYVSDLGFTFSNH